MMTTDFTPRPFVYQFLFPENFKAACFIPVRSGSTRVPGKNFISLAGKPLYQWIVYHCLKADVFQTVVVDTDSQEIKDWVQELKQEVGGNYHARLWTMDRDPELMQADGNDLIRRHGRECEGYDAVFQCFATAPFLSPDTIRRAVHTLQHCSEYDSVLTVRRVAGWFWRAGVPLNYRSPELPKSQEAEIIQETTGLYGIRTESLSRYGVRIGRSPRLLEVPEIEALDIDTMVDMGIVQAVGDHVLGPPPTPEAVKEHKP
jgi:N-acylneuraminate cytidylyltransferase